MEHFEDLLFQLMKHGTNTLHVEFLFLFSVVSAGSGFWCGALSHIERGHVPLPVPF